jgi:hypothetical protein
MSEAPAAGATRRERIAHELREYAVLAVYLFICFAAVDFYRSAVLRTEGFDLAALLGSAGKALVSAKFMLLGMALRVGTRLRWQALAWLALYRSFAFLLVLLLLTAVEEAVLGLLRGQTLSASLQGIGGGSVAQFAATAILLLLIFFPYFAFRALGERLGETSLLRLFFSRGALAAASAEAKS